MMNIKISIVCLFSCMFYFSHAQSIKKINEDEAPYFISFDNSSNTIAAKSKSNTNTSLTPLETLQKYLNPQPEDEFKLIKSSIDKLGYNHYRYQQYYKGIKVEFANYFVHYKAGEVYAMNGDYQKISNINNSPTLSESQALSNALNHINATQYSWEDVQTKNAYPKAVLLITKNANQKNDPAKLAYKFSIQAISPRYNSNIYVDAHSGDILFETSNHNEFTTEEKTVNTPKNSSTKNNSHTTINQNPLPTLDPAVQAEVIIGPSTNARRVEVTIQQYHDPTNNNTLTYKFYDPTRKIKIYHTKSGYSFKVTEPTLLSTGTPIKIDDLQLSVDDILPTGTRGKGYNRAFFGIYWAAQKTYDYFSTNHDWKGFDNNISTDDSYNLHDLSPETHGNFNKSTNEINFSYFQFNGKYMNPDLTTVAHEFTHAVINHTAKFNSQNKETEAINEGLSDIFGVTVNYNQTRTKEWRLGTYALDRGFRNISKPKSLNDPDTYRGQFWISGPGAKIHDNGQIIAHWYYLLSEGGTGVNDNGFRYQVNPIGIEKAIDIVWRALKEYMEPNTDYSKVLEYTKQAAIDLHPGSTTEAKAVVDAWNAVGIHEPCANNPTPYTLDFESGLKNWTTRYVDTNQSSSNPASFGEWQITTRSLNRFGPQTPNQGRHYLQSRVTEGESYITSPSLYMSENNLKLWFNFYLDQDLSESDPIFVPLPNPKPTPSNFKVEITTDNGATWNTELDLQVRSTNSGFWFSNYAIDLAKYYGICIKIRFSNTGALSERELLGVFTIDNIKIQPSSIRAKTNIRQDRISLNSNPVKNKLDLTLPENIQQYTYTIFGATGAEITTGTSNKKELTIDTSSLSKGMYFISIKGATINDGIRFIKK